MCRSLGHFLRQEAGAHLPVLSAPKIVIGDVLKWLVKGDTLAAFGTWGRSFCAGSWGHSLRQEAGARQPVLIAAKNRPVLW